MATEIDEELEKSAVEEKEKKIPVFTVLKNNSVLKNIFLIDTPPDSLLPAASSSSTWMIPKDKEQKEGLLEEILVVGRHPDCNITLEHPSISRFHLRIHSIPSLESLSVIDLSSVHGTWVSGKKIEAGVQVKLNEGDTLQLGGSSRVYRLHWVPLSCAYDMKNPFVPPLDDSEPVEQRAEQIHMHQDEDGLYPQDDQSDSVGDDFEGLDSLFADMNMTSSMKQVTPSATVVPEEDMKSTFSFEEDAENKIEIAEVQPVWQFDKEDSILKVCLASASHEQDCDSRPVTSQKRSGVSIWERRGKSASVHIETGSDREDCIEANADPRMQLENNENIRNGSPSQYLFTAADWAEEIFTPDKENHTPDALLNRPLKERDQDKAKLQFSGNSLLSSLDNDVEEAFTPDKENMTPKAHLFRSMKRLAKLEGINHLKSYRSSPLKSAGSIKHERVDVLVLSDDQNQVSKLLQEKKSANPVPRSLARSKADILKVREDRVPFQSLLVNSSKTKSEASDPVGAAIGSSKSVKNPQMTQAIHPFLVSSEEIRTWTMVVDTACLLDIKSRKALQLMQGLQGTSLIIPRIVIRELDCMKRHSTLFRRTVGVDSALQWIEECMVKAKWWIHVQSSLEDATPIAPTPRSIPLSESNEEMEKFSIGSIPYSPFGSLLDIVSPTTEDHVLECALFFRKIRSNGQLVLLSNDVTVKIKAMAEGLRCETAEEFRESLVNPFSERFLWTASSPRGPTWSCLDDVVLKEKYYNGPSRKQSKLGEPAKGLKLILRHNSQYKQINSVS